MQVRQEFRQFIGSTAWGPQKGFHDPTDEQLEQGLFKLPIEDGLVPAIQRSYLDFRNIGYNVDKFNALDSEVKTMAAEVAERRGTYEEIRSFGDQGQTAAIHMSNVASAQRQLIATMLGPIGPALAEFMTELGKNIPESDAEIVTLGVRTGGDNMVSGDVYQVSSRDYLGGAINGVSGKAVARVSVDFSTGDAYLWPSEAFTQNA